MCDRLHSVNEVNQLKVEDFDRSLEKNDVTLTGSTVPYIVFVRKGVIY